MKRLISIISVVALLCTMFSLPVMAEDAVTNNFVSTYTQARLSTAVGTNAAANGFTDVAPDNHILAGSNMGTHAHAGTYYKVLEGDAMAAPKSVSAVYGEASGKLCVDFTAFSSVWNAVKAYQYGENDRFYFSTYVSNLSDTTHGLAFMPSAGGVNMSKEYKYKIPKNVWTKIDVITDPNVTFTYKVNGVSKTVSTVGKTLPQNGNKGYATSSAGDANAEVKWTPILALDGSTYDANSTYVIEKVQFGTTNIYINGQLVQSAPYSASYAENGNNFYFYDVVPSRFVFNGNTLLTLSNMKFGRVNNFDEATYPFTQPALSAVEGEFVVNGAKLLTTKESISKADIVVPEGAVLKAYSKDSDVTVAGGYKYTEITGDTLPLGTLVTVQEDKDGGERITYTVAEDKVLEKKIDGSGFTSVGNATVAHATGVAGKAADDTSAVLTPNGSSEDSFFVAEYGMTAAQLAAFGGYMHFSFNAFTENTGDKINLRITTDQGGSVAANTSAYTTQKIFNSNQWNRVDIITKLEGGKTTADKGVLNGVSKTYVNGKYIGETNTHFGGYNSDGRHCTALRIGLNSKDTDDKFWIDDYKAVFSYGEPAVPAMPEAVTANIGDAVESVTAQGAKVYRDDAIYGVQLTEGTLAHNNVILKEENGIYVYYKVVDADIKHYMTSGDAFESRVRYDGDWSSSGIGGKSADDYSLTLTKHAVGEDASESDKTNYVNFYPQFTYNRGEGAKDYVVIGFNFYVPAESLFSEVGIYSQQHTNLGLTIGADYVARNKWNSIMTVIDYTGEKAAATMYLNGRVYGVADRAIDTKNVVDKTTNEVIETQQFGGSIFNQIRLSVRTGEYSDASTFYMDDIIVFETDEKFVPGKLGMEDTFNAKYDIALDDKIYAEEGEELTAAEIKADFAGAVVTRDGVALADDAVLAKNDVVSLGEVKDYVKGLAGYKALVYSGNTFGTDGIRMFKPNGNTTLKAGEKVIVRVVGGGVLAVVSYDESGAMTAVDSDMTAYDNYKEIKAPAAGGDISFIGFEGLNSLKPTGKNYRLTVE